MIGSLHPKVAYSIRLLGSIYKLTKDLSLSTDNKEEIEITNNKSKEKKKEANSVALSQLFTINPET